MTKYLARMGTAVAAIALVCLARPATAGADALTLTSGTLTLSRQDPAYFNFNALPTLSARAFLNFYDIDGYYPPYFCGGSDCAGLTVNLSMSDSLSRTPNANGYIVNDSFQLNGDTYWFQTLDYSIVAGDIVVVPGTLMRTWFRFSGNATGRADSGATASFAFSGRGHASTIWDSNNGWLATGYGLEDPAAVPEPASLLLLGTGLAGLAARRRRKNARA